MDGEEGEAQGGFQGLGAEGGQGDLAVLNGQVSDSAGHGGKVTPCSRCGLEQQSALSAHLTGEGFIGLAALHEAAERSNLWYRENIDSAFAAASPAACIADGG